MDKRDIHVLKYFSSFVSVSHGKVINITEPTLTFCPLAKHLYNDFRSTLGNDKEAIKGAIKNVVELKIKDYGFFTDDRKFSFDDVSIPYGASEMISFALRKKAIDAAVVVCEGAGTVVTDKPEIAQGIGARMNSLLLTSPIKGIIKKLKTAGCRVVFENALIDQLRGVREAIKAGYKVIAVTVCGHSTEGLKALRLLEKENGVKIISLAVCTTGIAKNKINTIGDYADLVWSCASDKVRNIIGPVARLQLSELMPVFVMSESGVDFTAGYCKDPGHFISGIERKKQYLISSRKQGDCISMGNFTVYIKESRLPVFSSKVPFNANSKEGLAAVK